MRVHCVRCNGQGLHCAWCDIFWPGCDAGCRQHILIHVTVPVFCTRSLCQINCTSTKVTALVPQCSCKVWCREHREPLLQSVGTVGLFPPAGFYFTHKKKKKNFSVIYSGYFGWFPPACMFLLHTQEQKSFQCDLFWVHFAKISNHFAILTDVRFAKLIYCSKCVYSKFYWGPFTRFKYSNLLIATGNCIIVETKNSFSIFSTFAC